MADPSVERTLGMATMALATLAAGARACFESPSWCDMQLAKLLEQGQVLHKVGVSHLQLNDSSVLKERIRGVLENNRI